MKSRKNRTALLLLCFTLALLLFPPQTSAQVSILRPYGGKIFPSLLVWCAGFEPTFDVVTPEGKTEGLFGTTLATLRFKYFSIFGIPGRNILLLASPIKVPICAKPCDENCCTPAGICPQLAYPVIMFGTSLTP